MDLSDLPFKLDPPVLLAPMAGITDLPFRNLVASFGAGLVVSEMVASVDMINARPGTLEKAELGLGIEGTAVQLAGREAAPMAEAARMVEGQGARVIDINMGCPAKKVTQGFSGSALMKTPDHALRLIEAVVNAVKVPVTLKTRLGWDDDMLNAPQIAAIAGVKQAVSIPVIANGDIISTDAARQALAQSGSDGVMIGRGAQGKPWLLAQVAHDLFGAPAPVIPQGAEFARMVADHYEAIIRFYGEVIGLRVARKHLGWYMDTSNTPADLRRAMLTASSPADVHRLIPSACLPDHQLEAA